jgi:tetratricopeptide (TPR) repeat protein
MARGKAEKGTPVQPTLAEMFARFLERQAEAEAAGIKGLEGGEVVPYDSAPVQPVDARLAWEEAQAALPHFHAIKTRKGLKAPTDWSSLVAGHEPIAALAFASGNFPQMVRDLHSLMQADDLARLRPTPLPAPSVPSLVEWADTLLADKKYPQCLLALGALRLAKQYAFAEERFAKHADEVPEEWRAAWDNERAALAWQQGKVEEAAALWRKLPASVPVLFNRGMSALFLGKIADARKALNEAIAQIPDDSAWHHLGRLYLALAEARD